MFVIKFNYDIPNAEIKITITLCRRLFQFEQRNRLNRPILIFYNQITQSVHARVFVYSTIQSNIIIGFIRYTICRLL